MSRPITDQQEMFCKEYIVDLNASAAARRAKYSEDTATQSASRLMADERIQARVQELFNERAARVELTADMVLRELLKIATIDLALIYDENGKLKNIHDIPEDVRRAIAGIEVDELFEGSGQDKTQTGFTNKIKLWDKPKALELLGRHLKLFTDKTEHSGVLTLEQLVAGSYDKDKKE